MIGDGYWSTGITIKRREDKWGVSLEFLDSGFVNQASTQGTLCARYLVDDLEATIDLLIEDAERIGIHWRGGPTIYAEGDGELEDGDHPELRAEANRQAERVGWMPTYSEARTRV